MSLPNLLSFKAAFLPLTLLAALAACGETNVETNSDRGPLGKADHISASCEDSCGGKSEGACWCDDECANYGDCCDDKEEICDAPEPTVCGGWVGDTCTDEEFCSFTASQICGWADASGFCAPRPEACTQVFDPVCGCDSQTYGNSCMAANAGTSVSAQGACEAQPIFCGGFGNIACPDGLECVDDPNDGCDPNNGGADCGGICAEPEECEPVLCELFCSAGFKTDDNGCEICACNDPIGPVDSCEGTCGDQSESGNCWCDDACAGYGDCCGDIDEFCSEPERVPAAGMCVKNSNDECQTDADCNIGGCGSEVCFNPDVSSGISTCECGGPGVAVSGCGCVEGSCTWYNE